MPTTFSNTRRHISSPFLRLGTTVSKQNHKPSKGTIIIAVLFLVAFLKYVEIWGSPSSVVLRSPPVSKKEGSFPDDHLGGIVLLAPQRNEGSIWGIDRFCFLLRAVRSVDQHLNSKFGPYPIHILVAKDFDKDPKGKDAAYTAQDRKLLQKWAPHSTIIFVEIEMYSGSALEPGTSVELIQKWRQGFDGSVAGRDVGYQSMCRLWSGRLQNLSFLDNTTYYMRLDDDSLLTKDLDYDPFERIREEQLLYVYRRESMDHWGIQQLWSIAKPHLDLQSEKELPFLGAGDNIYTGMQPYNNFHITKVAFWRAEKWASLWRDLNNEHAFFKYRVGDANVHAIASMLMGKEMIAEWREFPYVHNSNDDPGWGKNAWKEECEREYKDWLQ